MDTQLVFDNKLSWKYWAVAICNFCILVVFYKAFYFLASYIMSLPIVWFKAIIDIPLFVCVVILNVVFAFNEMRNEYAIDSNAIYVREYFLFVKRVDIVIPLKMIKEVKQTRNLKWIINHIELQTVRGTYMLRSITKRELLYAELCKRITE